MQLFRRSLVVVGILLLVYLPLSNAFLPSSKASPRLDRTRLWATAKNNANDNDRTESSSSTKQNDNKNNYATPNGLDREEKRKRFKTIKRYVDYPSFAYDARGRYETAMRRARQQQQTQASSFVTSMGDDNDEPIATYKQPSDDDTRTVSIPKKTVQRFSPLDRIVNAITSPNFGIPYEIQSVTRSAQTTRLLNNRCYARREPFAAENITVPPSLADLSPPPTQPMDRIWISSTFRIASFLLAYWSLPLLTQVLSTFVTMELNDLDEITGRFTPGISILYGTFVSLTLSILYNRQQAIQSNVSQESSLLTMLIRTMLSLCHDDGELAIRAGQCAADQIRTLVRGSRGGELLLVMYSDPYDRMMEVLDVREERYVANGQLDMGGKAGRIALCRDVLKDLNKLRATRLSDEAQSLPPTHFVILNALTTLILLGYVVSILPTVTDGQPSTESCLLFGFLCAVYVLFYNFIDDLNNPFQGVYQVRRSSTASHLLEAKWLIANHPLLRGQVDFEQVQEEPTGNVLIRSPGLGDLKFEKEDIFPDAETNNNEEEID